MVGGSDGHLRGGQTDASFAAESGLHSHMPLREGVGVGGMEAEEKPQKRMELRRERRNKDKKKGRRRRRKARRNRGLKRHKEFK